MIIFYDSALSGNCHKVRMMLGFLGLDFEVVPVNWAVIESHMPQVVPLFSEIKTFVQHL